MRFELRSSDDRAVSLRPKSATAIVLGEMAIEGCLPEVLIYRRSAFMRVQQDVSDPVPDGVVRYRYICSMLVFAADVEQ